MSLVVARRQLPFLSLRIMSFSARSDQEGVSPNVKLNNSKITKDEVPGQRGVAGVIQYAPLPANRLNNAPRLTGHLYYCLELRNAMPAGHLSHARRRQVLPKEEPGALHLLRGPREGGQRVGVERPLRPRHGCHPPVGGGERRGRRGRRGRRLDVSSSKGEQRRSARQAVFLVFASSASVRSVEAFRLIRAACWQHAD